VQKCGRSQSRIFAVVTWFFFGWNKTKLALRNKLDKVVIVGGSNNTGVWEPSPQPPETNGDSGAEPPTLKPILEYFLKKYAF